METQYLYTSIRKKLFKQLEDKLYGLGGFIEISVREEVGHVRYIIEIKHEPKSIAKINEVLKDYEDEWTDLEVTNWLDGVEKEAGIVEMVNLAMDRSLGGLEYYRNEFFKAGIVSTVVRQNVTGREYYILQTSKNYLPSVIETLNKMKEEEDVLRKSVRSENLSSLVDKYGEDGETIALLYADESFDDILEESKDYEKKVKNRQLQRYVLLFSSFIFLPMHALSLLFLIDNEEEVFSTKTIPEKIEMNATKHLKLNVSDND